MISGLTSGSQLFLTAVNRADERLARAERQITSGLKISTASDDPAHVAALLQSRIEVSLAEQTQTDLGRVKSEVTTAENALQTAVSIVEQMNTWGTQVATATCTSDQRATLGAQVQAIFGQLVGLTAVSVESRHLFSGDGDQVAPYTVNAANPNGVDAYQGYAATRKVNDAAGSSFTVARTAQEIFDAPEASVFEAVTSLANALNNVAGEDQVTQTTRIQTALDSLSTASDHLNSQLAFYGTVQNRVDDAIAFASDMEVQRKANTSAIGDADITEAILEFSQAQIQRQAALQAHSKIPQTTLFDYLG
jgi:flagellin-like hook-associated protein FlgL